MLESVHFAMAMAMAMATRDGRDLKLFELVEKLEGLGLLKEMLQGKVASTLMTFGEGAFVSTRG